MIQLMEYDDKSLAIRFAHYRNGAFQRAPLIVGVGDLRKLRNSIDENPKLKRALQTLLK